MARQRLNEIPCGVLCPAQKSELLAKKFVFCTLEGLIQRGWICDMDPCQLFVNCNSTKGVRRTKSSVREIRRGPGRGSVLCLNRNCSGSRPAAYRLQLCLAV